jgi:MazG family protein
MGDVVRGIAEKMIRRHPHVFGAAKAETAQEVVARWEEIKRTEKGVSAAASAASLEGIPASLPATLKALRVGARAARVGLDWPSPEAVLDKIEEETRELRSALGTGPADAARAELGDLLFSVVMLARKMDCDPEAALERTLLKFRGRFARVEEELQRRGIEPKGAGAALLEELWERAKATEGRPGRSRGEV